MAGVNYFESRKGGGSDGDGDGGDVDDGDGGGGDGDDGNGGDDDAGGDWIYCCISPIKASYWFCFL